jgi:hypothetical protein
MDLSPMVRSSWRFSAVSAMPMVSVTCSTCGCYRPRACWQACATCQPAGWLHACVQASHGVSNSVYAASDRQVNHYAMYDATQCQALCVCRRTNRVSAIDRWSARGKVPHRVCNGSVRFARRCSRRSVSSHGGFCLGGAVPARRNQREPSRGQQQAAPPAGARLEAITSSMT